MWVWYSTATARQPPTPAWLGRPVSAHEKSFSGSSAVALGRGSSSSLEISTGRRTTGTLVSSYSFPSRDTGHSDHAEFSAACCHGHESRRSSALQQPHTSLRDLWL